jgi:hypothetical protein
MFDIDEVFCQNFIGQSGAEKFGVVSGSIYLRPHFQDSIFY